MKKKPSQLTIKKPSTRYQDFITQKAPRQQNPSQHKLISINLTHLTEPDQSESLKISPEETPKTERRALLSRFDSGFKKLANTAKGQTKRCKVCTRSTSAHKLHNQSHFKLALPKELAQKEEREKEQSHIKIADEKSISQTESSISLSQFSNPQLNEDQINQLQRLNTLTSQASQYHPHLEEIHQSLRRKFSRNFDEEIDSVPQKRPFKQQMKVLLDDFHSQSKMMQAKLDQEQLKVKERERRIQELEEEIRKRKVMMVDEEVETEGEDEEANLLRALDISQKLMELCVDVFRQSGSFYKKVEKWMKGEQAHGRELQEVMGDLSSKLLLQLQSNSKYLNRGTLTFGAVEMSESEERKTEVPEEETTKLDTTPDFEWEDEGSPFKKVQSQYDEEDLISLIQELSRKMRFFIQNQRLAKDDYLERLRRKIVGEDLEVAVRPSQLDLKNFQLMETPRRTSIFELYKSSKNTEKELEDMREKKEMLESQVEMLEKKLEDSQKEIFKWQKKYKETVLQKPPQQVQKPKQTEFKDRLSQLQDLLTAEGDGPDQLKVLEDGLKRALRPRESLTGVDLERLRMCQEELFDIVNLLRQEIEQDDIHTSSRLVYKRNKLIEAYPLEKQTTMSREIYEKIQKEKRDSNGTCPLKEYVNSHFTIEDIRPSVSSIGISEDDSLPQFITSLNRPHHPFKQTSHFQRLSLQQEEAPRINYHDLFSFLVTEASAVEGLL